MSLFAQPPVVPLATYTLRTHELQLGSEIVRRDGTSVFVIDRGGDGAHILVQLSDGRMAVFRRRRKWRVIAPPAEVGVPFLAAGNLA